MASSGRFSQLLLEGLDHYRKGRMLEAVRVWEEAYLLEPTNLRAREFLRSALERIHAHMGGTPNGGNAQAAVAGGHPWLPPIPPPPDLLPQGPLPGAPPKAAAPSPAARKPPPPPPPESPWDEGPSVAIPQPHQGGAVTPDETSGAWRIHKDAQPSRGSGPDDEVEVWKRGARELVALNDFSGALELVGKILERKPGDPDARKMLETCEHNLTQMYESKLGSMEARPRVAIPPDEIIWLNLDPRAGFVLAQIDGEVSFDDLYAVCGLRRLDTARILSELLEQGVVRVDGKDAPAGKRAQPR